MSPRAFKAMIREGTTPVGTLVTLGSPAVAELLALCGFDWLFIDMEHGPFDLPLTQETLRSIGATTAIVRVPENSPLWIRRVLDIGADGIIVPLVCSAEEARRAVRAAKYPPEGERGAGIARAHGYGLRFAPYVQGANDHITVIVQVEHITAVERLDEIIGVPGVDGVLIGPYDLSGSMNRLGEVTHPEVQSAIAGVRARCRERGMPVGLFVLNPDDVPAQSAGGLDFIAVGTDAYFLSRSALGALGIARRRAEEDQDSSSV